MPNNPNPPSPSDESVSDSGREKCPHCEGRKVRYGAGTNGTINCPNCRATGKNLCSPNCTKDKCYGPASPAAPVLPSVEELAEVISKAVEGRWKTQTTWRIAATAVLDYLRRAGNGWVKTSERLPEDDSNVFAAIWWRNTERPEQSHYEIHDCSYYEGGIGSGQKIFTDCEGEEYEPGDVQFWMYKKDLAATVPPTDLRRKE